MVLRVLRLIRFEIGDFFDGHPNLWLFIRGGMNLSELIGG